MSFLETGKSRFIWGLPVAHTSVRPELGCVQCGSRLDPAEYGKFNLTGKCFNCVSSVSDDDEYFDDFES